MSYQKENIHVNSDLFLRLMTVVAEFYSVPVISDNFERVKQNQKKYVLMKISLACLKYRITTKFIILLIVLFYRRIPSFINIDQALYYCNTQNGEAAVRKFQSNFPSIQLQKQENLSFLQKLPSLLTIFKFQRFEEFWRMKVDSDYARLQQLIGYVVWTSIMARDLKGRILLVTNDHSPTELAVAMKWKSLGGKVIYVQHAHISKYFPKLWYDLVILDNEVSRLYYEQTSGPFVLANDAQKIIVKKPVLELSSQASLVRKERQRKYLVVFGYGLDFRQIYHVFSQIEELRDFYVKTHPRDDRALPSYLSKYCLVDSFKSAREMGVTDAIVGNSSSVIELLQLGIRVCYSDELDTGPYDYYSFVSEGLIPRYNDYRFEEHYTGTKFKNAVTKYFDIDEHVEIFEDMHLPVWCQTVTERNN